MEFVSDFAAGLRGPVESPGSGAQDVNPEWFVLRSRLTAAHAARGSLLSDSAARVSRPGSFEGGAAAAFAPHPAKTPDVNPIDLGDGKSDARKEDGVAARTWADDARVPR